MPRTPPPPPPNADQFAQQLRHAHDKFSKSLTGEGTTQQVMSGFADAYRAWLEAMSAKPETMLDLQGRYMQEQLRLWMNAMQPGAGEGGAAADNPFPQYASDNLAKIKQSYADAGGARSNTRYGWLRTRT